MRSILFCLALASILATSFIRDIHAEEKAVQLDMLPKAVSDAVKNMFPTARILKASQEQEEENEVEYEVSIKVDGKKIDIMIEDDGEIETLEVEIALKDLPKAVTETLGNMYDDAKLQSSEAVYEVEDGKQELEFYEVQLKSKDGKAIEAKIKPNGKTFKDDDELEESGEREDEE